MLYAKEILKNGKKTIFEVGKEETAKGWKGICDFDPTKVDADFFWPNLHDGCKKNFGKTSQGRFFTTVQFCPKYIDLAPHPIYDS